MPPFTLDRQVTMAAVVAAATLIFSLITYLLMQRERRRLATREYADKIRHAAALPAIALERWRELAIQFFNDIQPLITDADGMISKGDGVVATRDFLWRGLCAARVESVHRQIEADLEGAYVDLFGYDPKVQAIYQGAVSRLKEADTTMNRLVLSWTQADVTSFADRDVKLGAPSPVFVPGTNGKATPEPIFSAHLGNRLRETCQIISELGADRMAQIIQPIHEELLRLINSTDKNIVNHKVTFRSTSEVFDTLDGEPFVPLDTRANASDTPSNVTMRNEAFFDRIAVGVTLPEPPWVESLTAPPLVFCLPQPAPRSLIPCAMIPSRASRFWWPVKR